MLLCRNRCPSKSVKITVTIHRIIQVMFSLGIIFPISLLIKCAISKTYLNDISLLPGTVLDTLFAL